MFGPSLLVAFGINFVCTLNGGETGGLLNEACQINLVFGDIKDFIEQKGPFVM
jgi:hypothetical protein